MSRRLEVLQWLGLLLGAATWAAVHVVGYGVTEAHCSSGGSSFGIQLHLWEGLALGLAEAVVLGSALAAAAVIRLTAYTSYESDAPVGRIRFFAIAALIANVLFAVMIALYAAGAIANVACRQG
ncbi:MAG TPA: hypothetical protein VH297_02290 [Gaiellaceae bacterium]|jgi:hypothetical protein